MERRERGRDDGGEGKEGEGVWDSLVGVLEQGCVEIYPGTSDHVE